MDLSFVSCDWCRLVSSSEEIKVWRRTVPEGTYGGEYPCVKVRPYQYQISSYQNIYI